MKLWRILHIFAAKKRLEREMSDDMQAHLGGLTRRNHTAGMPTDEAHNASRRGFGELGQLQEHCRDEHGWAWLSDIWQDLRYGIKQLRKSIGFASITILTLAIGVGATTAIFSIVNGVVLQPLPYPNADRLVSVREESAEPDWWQGVSRQAFEEWQSQTKLFESIGTSYFWPGILSGTDQPVRLYGWKVSVNFFQTLGVQPILGRTFRPEEGVKGQDNVVIISHRAWLSHFGGTQDVIGRSVIINDQRLTIIGVMPKRFLPETITDPTIFMPDSAQLHEGNKFERYMEVVGRLKPGVTFQQAVTELNVIVDRIALRHSDTREGWGLSMKPLLDAKIGEVRPLLFMLLGAVGFLLLIACVNVANLLLARASSRGKEIAIRAALGASRGRIIRQLLCESILLSVVSSFLGVLIAYVGMDLLLLHAPLSLPRAQEIAVDGHALIVSSALALLTGIGFGIAPALQASRVNLASSMNAAARGSSEGARTLNLRGVLVSLEFSLALVLLLAAGLLMHSFIQLQRVSLGYKPAISYVSRMLLQDSHYPTSSSRISFVNMAVERLSAIPGVHSVVFSNLFPSYGWSERQIAFVDHPELDPDALPNPSYCVVTPDYFSALSIPLVGGRLFTSRDDDKSESAAIVSQSFASKYFPGENPIGKQITVLGQPNTTRQIIGVVGDVRDRGPLIKRPFQVYVPYAQDPIKNPHLLVRLDENLAGIQTSLRRAMDTLDSRMPLSFNGIDLVGFLNETIAPQRYALFLFGVFSAVALLLSAMGIYGMVSYSVSQRAKEIGIRMALGARITDIQRLIIFQTGRMLGWGLLIGLTVSVFSSQLLGSLLYQVSPHDILTYFAVSLALIFVALFACWFPARRAAKVDPNIALRAD